MCILAFSIVPVKAANMPVFNIVVIIASFASSFVGISVNSLSAHNTPGNLKGRASGYIQAGNVGGSAIGGGAGLWLSQHMADWLAGGIMAFAFLLCGLSLLYLKEPDAGIRVKSIGKTARNLLKDVW